MRFRWTIKQCKKESDEYILRGLIAERMSDLGPYTPLRDRLQQIYNKLDTIVKTQPSTKEK